MPLGLQGVDRRLRNTMRTIDSQNVVAKLEGSDPRLRDEYVVYSAHWDHLGVGTPVNGDKIYNGALDNASGVAALLEIARAFTQVEPQAEALDPVPVRDRRRTGAARLASTTRRTRSIRWRRPSPTSTSTA